jgi:transcription antitermination factor NusG
MRELCPKSDAGADSEVMLDMANDNICMTVPPSAARWYALTVRHQHERQTERLLRTLGWETLSPVYKCKRQWSDRVKEVELPLFAGYVFCRFSVNDRVRVEDTPGVAQIVKFNGRAAEIEAAEIERIQAMLVVKVRLTPWPYLKAGDRVRVERGPLRGLEGTLLRDGDAARLVVSVEMLQRSIAAEVDPDSVVPIRARAAYA